MPDTCFLGQPASLPQKGEEPKRSVCQCQLIGPLPALSDERAASRKPSRTTRSEDRLAHAMSRLRADEIADRAKIMRITDARDVEDSTHQATRSTMPRALELAGREHP